MTTLPEPTAPLATGRAALRDRIAEALEQADYRPDMRRGDLADAIMPVLPAPADRAAVLREAADLAEDVAVRLHNEHDVGGATGAYEAMTELRRLADETQQPEAVDLPYTHTDDDSDQLIIGAVNASTYEGDVPQVFVCAREFSYDAKEETTVYVRPEFVERAVAAMRAARIEADRMAAVVQQPKEA
ncbi:MAG: hypothetical protein ACJ768_08135 [Gaiellaceae bacterium]